MFLECRIHLCFLSVCVSVAIGVGGCVLVCFLCPEAKERERDVWPKCVSLSPSLEMLPMNGGPNLMFFQIF